MLFHKVTNSFPNETSILDFQQTLNSTWSNMNLCLTERSLGCQKAMFFSQDYQANNTLKDDNDDDNGILNFHWLSSLIISHTCPHFHWKDLLGFIIKAAGQQLAAPVFKILLMKHNRPACSCSVTDHNTHNSNQMFYQLKLPLCFCFFLICFCPQL